MPKNYFVVSVNKTKVGFYYFTGFYQFKPLFEPNHCVVKGPRMFKSKKAAQNALNRVNEYYKNNPNVISMIVNNEEFDQNTFYDKISLL